MVTVKYKIFLFILLFLVLWKCFEYFGKEPPEQIHEIEKSGSVTTPVEVTVYYEALCSDSRNFILKQLVPAFEAAPRLMHLQLIPYGKAETIEKDGIYTFKCQHSELECLANKIHACVLEQPLDATLHLKYIACMINDNMIPHDAGHRCAQDLDIEYGPIEECANGNRGSMLLKAYGERTHAVRPSIKFIPTIELDGAQKVPLARILKDFFKEVCHLYDNPPLECIS